MRRLTAEFFYGVPGLFVHRDVLGQTIHLATGSWSIEVALPSSPDDFRRAHPSEDDLPAIFGPSEGTVDDPNQFVSVRILRVRATGDSDLPSSGYDRDAPGHLESVNAFFTVADEVASSRAVALIDWARSIYGQAWLNESNSVLEHEGIQSLIDEETDERLPVGLPQSIVGVMLDSEDAITQRSLKEIGDRLTRGEAPPAPERFLADASHALWPAGHPDPTRGVVLAAVASEVKVKAGIRECATDEQAALIELVIERPADVSVSVMSLLDKGFDALVGRSLKREKRQLYDGVARLMSKRNDLVHRGMVPSLDDARAGVRAVREAFGWVDEVVASRSASLDARRGDAPIPS
jgi:hypothetical protein